MQNKDEKTNCLAAQGKKCLMNVNDTVECF